MYIFTASFIIEKRKKALDALDNEIPSEGIKIEHDDPKGRVVEIKATICAGTDVEAKVEKEKILATLCERLGNPINPILTKIEIIG